MVKTLILTGYGINCDYETEHAFKLAGSQTERVHVNDLIAGKRRLDGYQILALPGGFSYGDDIAAGKVLASKMLTNLDAEVRRFVDDGKLAIGVCNGFQVMVKYALLPRVGGQEATLTFNDSGKFEDRWVYMKAPKSKCVWTRGIDTIYLPVRHGEGKLVAPDSVIKRMHERGQVALQYCDANGKTGVGYPLNPNGSTDGIAGVCDETGRVFGLMPHPEAFLYRTNHPRWTRENVAEGAGLRVFRNAVEYAEKELV
jgi:phosphoribosylformylglycinamidine synthase